MDRTIVIIIGILTATVMSSCDLRSGTAKSEAEKYVSAPTPPISPIPTPTPVDPADIVEVDVNMEGDTIGINGHKQQTSANCPKFDRLRVNGDANEITVKGVCSQVMINGDANKIKIDAAAEIVFNGSDNIVQYSRYPNGKQPIVVENRAGNIAEKIPGETKTNSKHKIVK